MQIDLRHGDCVEVMKTLTDASVDAVVTDPPYELGFMGKGWDASGIAYSVAMWREVLRVLKPGGHLLAFGGTRTYHRMACAIEDAGFEIRDSIHWIYGSGFPKGLNLDGAWAGWGTALKPAHEPVVVARKPLIGTVADNVQTRGTGALNIDGCRVAIEAGDNIFAKNPHTVGTIGNNGIYGAGKPTEYEVPSGRWPPNILLTHAPECGEACADDCPVAEMDRQSGVSQSKAAARGGTSPNPMSWGTPRTDGAVIKGHTDSGGASRFFPVFRYQAKASRSERGTDNKHPTVKPVALMRWLVRLVTPPGGVVLEPFMGSGTTGVACVQEGFGFVGIEREFEYFKICKARIAAAQTESPAQKELFSA